MNKPTRAMTFSLILLSSTAVFTLSSQKANAFFFDPFENMVESSLNTMLEIVTTLSNDIGLMADRILVMSDNIGLMADRIVASEELLVSVISESGVSSLITAPVEGTVVSASTPINISLSSQKADYLLYMSNNADMSGATNALVQNNDTSTAWSRVADYATGTKLYIAVKTVGGSSSSDFSNTVMLNLQ